MTFALGFFCGAAFMFVGALLYAISLLDPYERTVETPEDWGDAR